MANYVIPERLREIDPNSSEQTLGGGFSFPTKITRGGSVELTSGEENIKSCILHIATYRKMDLFGTPTFGGNVPKLVFSVFAPDRLSQHEEWLAEAIGTWEKRAVDVRVSAGKSTDETTDTKVVMAVQYRVESTNHYDHLYYPVEGE